MTSTHDINSFGPTAVVDRLLEAIRCGNMSAAEQVYTSGTVLDAVVPGWRFCRVGDAAIRDEYSRWFAEPAVLEEVRRHRTAGGEVLEYTMSWVEHGVPHGARHVHVLDVDADRIVADHVWCGGRWPASLLAEMGASEQ
jgi:hypothetical protein